MENYDVLLQGFLFFSLFHFMYAINVKNKPQPSNWHQNHRRRGRGLVLQTDHGRTSPTHSNRAGGKCSKTQTPVEGPTQPQMELAGGAK